MPSFVRVGVAVFSLHAREAPHSRDFGSVVAHDGFATADAEDVEDDDEDEDEEGDAALEAVLG